MLREEEKTNFTKQLRMLNKRLKAIEKEKAMALSARRLLLFRRKAGKVSVDQESR